MTFLPLDKFIELAAKPIFTCTEWEDIPTFCGYSHHSSVTADLLCNKCGKEKTFSGKAYSRKDLEIKYQQENDTSNRNSNIPFSYDDGKSETVEDMIDECVLPVGDTITVQLKCPTCGLQVYICYAVEVSKEQNEPCIVFDKSNKKPNKYRAHKIGEYPNQEISRLQAISKYVGDFPKEHGYLLKAEKAFNAKLGVGAIIYLRKAYEVLLRTIAADEEIPLPEQFRQALEAVDKVANIVPAELKDRAYGLFGEMSNIVHGETDDSTGINKYELLRDVFKMILDNILEKRRLEKLVGRIKLDSQAKRGEVTK